MVMRYAYLLMLLQVVQLVQSICLDICSDDVITEFRISAMTGGKSHGGSDGGHKFKINQKEFHLYDRPGNDMLENKGDLWIYSADKIGLAGVKYGDITGVSFEAADNDGWFIASAEVIVKLESGAVGLLAGDPDMNKWLDGDQKDKHEHYTSIPLKILRAC